MGSWEVCGWRVAQSTAASNGANPVDNTALFASNGVLNSPSGNYQINYKAILAWINANCVQKTAGDGKPIWNGEPIAGVKTITYTHVFSDPGTYSFRCDFHPTVMIGTFIVQGSQ